MNQASWVGVIKGFGTDIPIRMAPATREQNYELHFVCLPHSSRVEQTWQCEANGELVEKEDLGTAFMRDELSSTMVIVTEEDKNALEVRTEQAIEITETRPLHAFEPEWVVMSYWGWTDRLAGRALASLWRALDREQMVALGTIVLQQRLYPVALRAVARGKGKERERFLSIMRLRWPSEVRVAPAATLQEAESVETNAFRDRILDLNRGHMPMLFGRDNPRYVAMERLIADREEVERIRELQA